MAYLSFFLCVPLVLTALLLLTAVPGAVGIPQRLDTPDGHGYGGCGDKRSLQHSGYISIPSQINSTREKHIFYWLFGPRNKTKVAERYLRDGSLPPVVMWMTGGPGCSSGIALLQENGPCLMNETSAKIYNNPYGWNEENYLLYVDQPVGVGYSYGDEDDYIGNETQVGNDMYAFLQGFAKRFADPSIISSKNDFYIIGESYGGHYVPSVAYRILIGNERGDGPIINLKGIAVGNGLTDPYTQYPAYAELAFDYCKEKLGHPCISEEDYNDMQRYLPACLDTIALCNAGDGPENMNACADRESCDNYTQYYYDTGLNSYDIRKPCIGSLCYPMNNTERFFNDKSVQTSLGVYGAMQEQDQLWVQCSSEVGANFATDYMRNFNFTIPPLLSAGIRVMIYAGDMDFICNWIGNKLWVNALQWDGHDAFVNAPDVTFKVGDRWAGEEKYVGNFSFVRIYDAGHMVPMDQPEASAYMLRQFLHDERLAKSSDQTS